MVFGRRLHTLEKLVSDPYLLNNIMKKLVERAKWVTGHCNRAAVSRNRYGVAKTVDTHKILINAVQFCLSSRNMMDKTMCEVL
jgi:hypothetical protein